MDIYCKPVQTFVRNEEHSFLLVLHISFLIYVFFFLQMFLFPSWKIWPSSCWTVLYFYLLIFFKNEELVVLGGKGEEGVTHQKYNRTIKAS